MSSIGVDGVNHLGPYRKSIHANFGPYLFPLQPLNKQGMGKERKSSLASVLVLSLQMLLAVRTETCQTYVFGQTILQNLPKSTECQPLPKTHSWMQSMSMRRRSMKTPCRVNLPMLYRDVSQICWICKDQITPWMRRVHPRWQQ